MNILERLWQEDVGSYSQLHYRTDDYCELLQLYQRNKEKLRLTLNETQKEDLQKMQDVLEEMQNISECGAFMTGFRLAMQIMVASVQNQIIIK